MTLKIILAHTSQKNIHGQGWLIKIPEMRSEDFIKWMSNGELPHGSNSKRFHQHMAPKDVLHKVVHL